MVLNRFDNFRIRIKRVPEKSKISRVSEEGERKGQRVDRGKGRIRRQYLKLEGLYIVIPS